MGITEEISWESEAYRSHSSAIRDGLSESAHSARDGLELAYVPLLAIPTIACI